MIPEVHTTQVKVVPNIKLTFSPLRMVVSNRNLQTSRGPLFSGAFAVSFRGCKDHDHHICETVDKE